MNIDRAPNNKSKNPENKESREVIKGVLTMISDNVPGYQGGISRGEGTYHLRPMGPNEPLKGARIRSDFTGDQIIIIHDDIDISDLKPGDEVEFERKMTDFHKIGSSNYGDKKKWWIISSIKKIEK